jgi:hypothetical protein
MYEWVIGLVAALAAVGALVFTANSFIRLRKTEQIRLSESALKEIRGYAKEFDLLSVTTVSNTEEEALRQEQLYRIMDHTFGALNWYCFLIEIGEIKDEYIIDYFKRAIIDWHDRIFIRHMKKEIIIDETKFSNFKKVYQKFRQEAEEESKYGESLRAPKYFKPPKL